MFVDNLGLRVPIWKITFFVRGFCGIQGISSPSIQNISNTVSSISRRMITVFFAVITTRSKTKQEQKIAFYIDSKSIKHFCKLLTKSRDFLHFNFDRLTDVNQNIMKCTCILETWLSQSWYDIWISHWIDWLNHHYWAVVFNSMNINRNQ